MRAAALTAAVLLGCRGGSERPPPAQSSAAVPAAAQPVSPAVPVEAEAESTCAVIARLWRPASTEVRTVDSIVTPFASDTTVHACVVFVYQEHGGGEGRRPPVDSEALRSEATLALVPGIGPGWVPLYRFSADGPDGSSLTWQRGRVRCLIEQSWDGGDDSDSTYVPADWYRAQTTCWLMPRPLTPADTAQG